MSDSRKPSEDKQSLKSDPDEFDGLVELHYEIKTDNTGYLNVYVQGNVETLLPTTPVFLTVHDLGANHHEFHKMVEHPSMARLKSRSVWIHVDLPGQEFDSPDLPQYFEFPTLDKVADDLVAVLDFFKVKYCITLGEGAGANILLRFTLSHPERVLGNVLIHCEVNVHGMTKFVQDKIMSWKLSSFGMNSTADQYLVYHKFGMYLDSRKDLDREKMINRFLERLHKHMNPKNLRLYVDAYLARNDLNNQIKGKLSVETMIVSGSYPHLKAQADELQAMMNPKITTRINLEHCGSVLGEAPDHFTYDLLLFCQGLGLFSALPISRNGSMSVGH